MAGDTKVIIIKKKAKGGHGHHGGAWKVAYADFVTAMMALFMVLWLVSQTDVDTQTEIAHYFRSGMLSGGHNVLDGRSDSQANPIVARGQHGEDDAGGRELGAAAESTRRELERAAATNEGLADMMRNGHLQIEVRPDGLLIQVTDGSEGLMFDLGSASPSSALTALLASIAPSLATLGGEIHVNGHTDARPFPSGDGRTNWDLSFERADAARRVLESHGLPRGRVVAVVAHADADPLHPEDPMDPRNRRLSIFVFRRVAAGRAATPEASAREPAPAPEPAREPEHP